jgi:site-specific recombinase XerD
LSKPATPSIRDYFSAHVSASLGLESERRYFAKAINQFHTCLGREPMMDDLTPERMSQLSAWLASTVTYPSSRQRLLGTLHFLRRQYVSDCGHTIEPKHKLRLLSAVLSRYVTERTLSDRYRNEMAGTLRDAENWRCSPLSVDDLNDELLNNWLLHLERRGLSRETIRNKRRIMITLWREAFYTELIDKLPRRVRKIPRQRRIPEAWSKAEMAALLKAAADWPGKIRFFPITRASFWTAFVLTQWDSALRVGDMRRLRREQIGADGQIVLVQEKSQWPVCVRLRPETVQAIDAMGNLQERPTIFGVLSRRQFFINFATLVKRAGLKGGSHKIRKSSATWLEAEKPGAAMAHLGHRTPGLAHAHYIDPRYVQQGKPLPPTIDKTVEPAHDRGCP